METRYISGAVHSLALKRMKLAFISGPRQVGKTTFAQNLGKEFDQFIYKNWDATEFRRIWGKGPDLLLQEFKLEKLNESKLLILDEIHKSKGWKQKLKGLYDLHKSEINMLVTGSARLDIYKKGGDSLLGRNLNFRLHPFTLGEASSGLVLSPQKFMAHLLAKPSPTVPAIEKNLERLLKFSGFPEPFLEMNEKEQRIWQRSRVEKVVREDLRDLSKLTEISQVEILVSLLPEKIGSPLSVQSLREDLGVSFDTVKRWLKYLRELYLYFEIRPWTKSIARSLKKEPKIYLYDWTVIDAPGPRFENLVACHIQKACHFWTDTGEGLFELCYLRNKEKQEVDFVIVKDHKPWLGVEAKLQAQDLEKSMLKFQSTLGIPFVQVCREEKIYRKYGEGLLQGSVHSVLGGI